MWISGEESSYTERAKGQRPGKRNSLESKTRWLFEKAFTFDFEMRSHWRVLSVKRWHRAFCGEETEDDQGRRKEITYETIH